MKKNSVHRSNFLFLLLIGHIAAGFPSGFLRRQLTGESSTGLPDWFWYGITGLDAAAGAINGWVNDLVSPNAPALDPAAVPGTTTTDGKNSQVDRGPDILLETVVAPVKEFGG